MGWDVSEGRAKNLTKMRGGLFKHNAATAISELLKCLTKEPSWLQEALKKAVSEYAEEEKDPYISRFSPGKLAQNVVARVLAGLDRSSGSLG